MAKSILRRSHAARALLFSLAASAALATPAAASSVVTIGERSPAPSIAQAKTPAAGARPRAMRRHVPRPLRRDPSGEFAALKAASDAAGEPADASLPGMLLFPPAGRAQAGDNAAALRTAAALAKARGRMAGPLDANAKWIATRIREDLGDFLSQGETTYLCSGIDAYLATLREQAARIGQSPDRLSRQIELQREAARASLDAARAALAPAPKPRFAPGDRPGEAIVADNLRSSVGLEAKEVYGPPMRVADRQDVRISESRSDPDLPALKASEALASAQDIARTVRDLTTRAEAAGALRDEAVAGTDPLRTGALPLIGPVRPDQRPAIRLLADLQPRLVGPTASPAADPHQRADLVRALSDLEALDYLLAAQRAPTHPLPAALEATFGAIEKAHAEACACKP